MTTKEYQEECRRTSPSFEQDLQVERRVQKIAMLLHAQLGIASEAGELADALKKYAIYGRLLDLSNINEELGDLLWYISLACDAIGLSMADVMNHNINKLRIRYPEKFTEEAAAKRADKV